MVRKTVKRSLVLHMHVHVHRYGDAMADARHGVLVWDVPLLTCPPGQKIFTREFCPPGHYSLEDFVPLGHYSLVNNVPPQ